MLGGMAKCTAHANNMTLGLHAVVREASERSTLLWNMSHVKQGHTEGMSFIKWLGMKNGKQCLIALAWHIPIGLDCTTHVQVKFEGAHEMIDTWNGH